jgi:large subunit ribosomal protein L4
MAAKLEENVFEAPVRTDLLHAVTVSQLAARRRGTAATKNRSLVSGGGRKPHRQKGTGRARHGSIRTNIWAGGGVVFGPQPRSFEQRIPKKVRRAALRSALSLKKRDGLLAVVDSFEVPEIKTKRVVERLRELDAEDALIVTAERDRMLERAARNLPRVQVLPAAALNVRGVLARKHLIMTEAAVRAVVERLS